MSISKLYRNGLFAPDSGSYKWWMLVIAMLGTFMAVVDVTIVNVALPVILKQYHQTIEVGEWVVTAYLIVNVLLLPLSGWLAMRFGFKTMLLWGVGLFTLGSLMGYMSQTIGGLIIGRMVEGGGSGIIMPLGMALITREFTAKERAFALGFWAMATAASVSLGPMTGGFLVSDFGWKTIFEVNIPLGLATIVAIVLILREWKSPTPSPFDVKGFVLMCLWLPLGLFLLSAAQSMDVLLIILLAVVVVGAFAEFVRHSLRAATPLVDIKLMKDRNLGLAMVIMLFYGVGMYGGNYLLPLYVEHTLNYTPIQAGDLFLPVGIIQGVMAPLSGYFSRWVGNKRLLFSGMVVFVAYLGVSALFDATTPHWVVMLSLYLRGVGLGLSFTALNTLSLENVSTENMASASGISNTVRQYSGSAGIAALTIILVQGGATHYAEGVRMGFFIVFIIVLLGFIPMAFLKEKKKGE